MQKVVISATRRTVTGKKVGVLRREGKLPGVIYGHHVEPISILMDSREATHILSTITGSSLVTIDVEGKEYPTLVREKQRDYVKNALIHIDFLAVSLTEKIRAAVGTELTGLAPAIKDFNANIVHNLNVLEVECFPQDLPEQFVIDVSSLASIGDAIYVRDVVAPDKVEILTPGDEIVAVATATKEEAVVEEAVEAAAAEPEVIERGKKEEEGEEAAA
ncbi:ribosomal protein L25, Ctc-form [Longilinea arvoryzae]|uniref:Large ribosomal subunit protein bL25 n=1 Tax=Longilinea arvoryzae TaxID=360412 RepID=A0A0S7BGD8_9CHLR|nr:50S ribosomal protein L25 [Longilinea arvoryzae]GAP14653.1 ribosomal protein L25, Ctc-form [Longilinea arvoryzae]